ncbi:MAG TPA: porin family protein [Flavisolibacter sp.]|nr:porin family protein [Flavisolibacter sp.]
MKKIITTFVLIFSIAFANAQINYGVKGGAALTTLTGDGYKAKAGFYAGGYAQFSLKNSFSVQPEIYYATQGANWESDGKTALGYVNIPVLAKYTTSSGFYGESGPQVGFMLSAHDTYKGETEDVKQYLKTTDFSWAFGAGYQVNPQIGINARYNLGLSKFWKDEKNSVILVGIHYSIGATKR